VVVAVVVVVVVVMVIMIITTMILCAAVCPHQGDGACGCQGGARRARQGQEVKTARHVQRCGVGQGRITRDECDFTAGRC
jgi:hypothetical protein